MLCMSNKIFSNYGYKNVNDIHNPDNELKTDFFIWFILNINSKLSITLVSGNITIYYFFKDKNVENTAFKI